MAHDLHPFVGEVAGETTEGQARPVDGGLANDAFRVELPAAEAPDLQVIGVFFEELFDRDSLSFHKLQIEFRAEVNFPGLLVAGQKLRAAGHEHLTFVDNVTAVNDFQHFADIMVGD